MSPIYADEWQGKSRCARSLRDGTLIIPIETPRDEDEDEWVRVQWQGDAGRETRVRGMHITQLALVDYAAFHKAGRPAGELAGSIAHLADHFERKTGEALGMSADEPLEDLLRLIAKLTDKLGVPALIEVLKRLLG